MQIWSIGFVKSTIFINKVKKKLQNLLFEKKKISILLIRSGKIANFVDRTQKSQILLMMSKKIENFFNRQQNNCEFHQFIMRKNCRFHQLAPGKNAVSVKNPELHYRKMGVSSIKGRKSTNSIDQAQKICDLYESRIKKKNYKFRQSFVEKS